MHTVITMAINNRAILTFRYEGTLRRVEPHLLGYKADGNLVLSAWRLSGGSGVDWRDFLVAKMSALAATAQTFAGARPGYNPSDRTMTRVVCRL